MIYLDPRYYFRYMRTTSDFTNILPLCSSLDNYFIPVFAGIDGSFIQSGNKKALLYNVKQSTLAIYPFPTTITKFLSIVHSGRQYSSFISPATHVVYYTMKHFIYIITEGIIIPLYCLCYSRDDIFTVDRDQPDFSKMFLIISNELLKSEHRVLYLKIKSTIKYFTELGINIMYTDNSKNLYFKIDITETKFNTINERVEYINRVKQIAGLYYEEPKKQVIQPISEPRAVTIITAPLRQVRDSTAIPDPEIWNLF